MNKAITEGLVFMPPKFRNGLNVWSTGDGTAGSDTFDGAAPGSFVTADGDFDGCLEVAKAVATLPIRHMGKTPIRPGCYLRVTARVKAMSGALPSVRIAGTPLSGSTPIGGLPRSGPAKTLRSLGDVVEISAIIGTGNRTGVDMVWNGANAGHIGLDLAGTTGGVVRIDDITIEDVTNVFLRDMIGMVDVRDYGAIGNGTADDGNAFVAANAAAQGREILVPAGTYLIDRDITLNNPVRFEGKLVMPDNRRIIMQHRFNYETYLDAFKDEKIAFKKAYQALLNYTDHDSLDMGGRRVTLDEPIDMQAAEGTKTRFEVRRAIHNGQLEASASPAWEPTVVQSTASYNRSNERTLTNVVNVANIPVGSLVEGNGVGREIYVRARNIAAKTLTLSQPLWGAQSNQNYTFTRFKYMLDFSGYQKMSQFQLSDMEIQCNGHASAIMLPLDGSTFELRDSTVNRPHDRIITSIGTGCQDLMLEHCHFRSNEMNLPVSERKTMVFNVNANDMKIRNCRSVRFEHFGVVTGTGHTISGNHWFHGDDTANGIRKPGLIIANTNPQMSITSNYIDNNTVEWTNEYEADPDNVNQYSFGGLTIDGNNFVVSNVNNNFRWLSIKPYGNGHYIDGFAVTNNVFRTFNSLIDRVDRLDTTYATLDNSRHRNFHFNGNTFHGVAIKARNPLPVEHNQSGATQNWVIGSDDRLPFGGGVRWVSHVCPVGQLKYGSNADCFEMPAVFGYQGGGGKQAKVKFSQAVRGKIRAEFRMDNPL